MFGFPPKTGRPAQAGSIQTIEKGKKHKGKGTRESRKQWAKR
jgi:hypothetical protein